MKNSLSYLAKGYTGLVLLFLYMPIAIMIVFSFNSTKSRSNWTGFSWRWYEQLLHNEEIIRALMATLTVAAVSAVVATLLGTLAAVGIQGMKKASKSATLNFTYLPIVSPEIILGVSLMLLFVLFNFNFGIGTLIIAHITFNLPYVILCVMPKLRQVDKHIFEAALDLGCTARQAFVKVMLPEIMPGIVTGFLMSLTFSLDDFNVSYFVSGDKFQTLPILIYSMTRRRISPEINALSTIIFVVVLLILVAVNLKDIRKAPNKKEVRRSAKQN